MDRLSIGEKNAFMCRNPDSENVVLARTGKGEYTSRAMKVLVPDVVKIATLNMVHTT